VTVKEEIIHSLNEIYANLSKEELWSNHIMLTKVKNIISNNSAVKALKNVMYNFSFQK
jgi:hypothetical protein